MSEQHPEYIRQHVGQFYDAVLSLVMRHDPLGLIRLGLPAGEYAPPVRTIVQRLQYEFTPSLEVVYQEFTRWAEVAGSVYQQHLGTQETFREIAEEIDALQERGVHLTRADRVRVSYTLFGDFDPLEVVAIIDIPVDATKRTGEPAFPGQPLPVAKQSYVRIESGLPPTMDIESHVAALIGRLQPGWETLVELGQRYSAVVQYVLATDENTGPAMGLSLNDMRAFVELNASVDVDIYCFT